MNQILNTNLNANNNKTNRKKNWFKIQFSFSIVFTIMFIICGSYYLYYLGKKEKFSNNLIANYNIYRLYSSSNNTTYEENSNGIFGIIEIPKINLYYPVFSSLTEDLLKVSPCKFYGENPKLNGNICIAGHNYDNSLFFSKISTLSTNDEIFIFDNNSIKYIYSIYSIYEVAETDLSPILNYEENEKTLTLVTCNNFTSNRIIVRAKQKQTT